MNLLKGFLTLVMSSFYGPCNCKILFKVFLGGLVSTPFYCPLSYVWSFKESPNTDIVLFLLSLSHSYPQEFPEKGKCMTFHSLIAYTFLVFVGIQSNS